MSGSFDIDNLKNAAYTVGYMDQRVIETLGLSIKPGPIKISRSRIRHTKKHEIDFPNRSVYKLSVESIPDIIETPDYVSLHPDGESIRYIKKISDNLVVAVGLEGMAEYWIKTFFPITDDKLELYKESYNTKAMGKNWD